MIDRQRPRAFEFELRGRRGTAHACKGVSGGSRRDEAAACCGRYGRCAANHGTYSGKSRVSNAIRVAATGAFKRNVRARIQPINTTTKLRELSRTGDRAWEP